MKSYDSVMMTQWHPVMTNINKSISVWPTHFSWWRRAARWQGQSCWDYRCSSPRLSCWRYWTTICSPWSPGWWCRSPPSPLSPRGSWPSCRCGTRRCTGAGWAWSPARRSERSEIPRPRGTPPRPLCRPRGRPRRPEPCGRLSLSRWRLDTRRSLRLCLGQTLSVTEPELSLQRRNKHQLEFKHKLLW